MLGSEDTGRATMREVAKRAGVALTTVSRAFSVPDKLSPATLERIARASADLDYTLNLNARALRGGSTGVVLVLLPDIGNPFFSTLLKGMEEAAREQGRALLIGDTGGDPALRDRYARQIQARTADALILLDGQLPFAPGSPGRRHLMGVPVVAVSEHVAEPEVPYVGIDNVAAARDVALMLAELGHRRVAHIRGRPGNILSVERSRGFAAGAASTDMTVLGEVDGMFSIDSGRAAASIILRWPERPTAVFAANDEMAMGAVATFKEAGLGVPHDMSVVGFDDIVFSALLDPALATVCQPRHAMGRAAMEIVNHGGQTPSACSVILPHRLIRRASLGPPPA